VLTSDDMFELPKLPDQVTVIRTGLIGLELQQALHRLDVTTTFFNPMDELGRFSDPAVDRAARRALGDGLDLRLGTAVESAAPRSDGVHLTWRSPDGSTKREDVSLVDAGGSRVSGAADPTAARSGGELRPTRKLEASC
jgi:dihydrolipoamide dehydrogenase